MDTLILGDGIEEEIMTWSLLAILQYSLASLDFFG
jgi:hypothetical protein